MYSIISTIYIVILISQPYILCENYHVGNGKCILNDIFQLFL